jgi:hypothetical protein
MGEGRNVYRDLMGRPEVKLPHGRPKSGWEDGKKMDVRASGWEGTEWIHLAQGREGSGSVVNTAMNLQFLARRS